MHHAKIVSAAGAVRITAKSEEIIIGQIIPQ